MTNVDLIKSFKQGAVQLKSTSSLGNCASIAIIKASIEIFGLNNLFEHSKETNVHRIVLKDGTELTFSDEELLRSNNVVDFQLNEEEEEEEEDKIELFKKIHEYSQFAICAMTKRVMEIGEAGQGQGNFEDSLRALNDGANTPNLPKALGLQSYFTNPKYYMSVRNKGMIGWLSGHTVYISQKYMDYYGSPQRIRFKYPRRMRIINY